MPEVFTTAHDAVFTQARLRAGERLLVHGAAGGVGTSAVQLGRAAGAHVTATVRRHEAATRVAELGADEVIDPEGFEEHGPFDVILELVGAPNLAGNLKALATAGRDRRHRHRRGREGRAQPARCSCGSARRLARLDAARPAARGEGAHRAPLERHVAPAVRDGALRVPVAETFPLDAGGRGLRPVRRGRQGRQDRAARRGRRMNAAERLWRGLAGARLGGGALAVPAHGGGRAGRTPDARMAGRRVRRRAARARRRGAQFDVRRVVTEGRSVVVEGAGRRGVVRGLLRPARRPDRRRGRVLGR